MRSVTSISGGRSSAMMAVEFPSDHYIFAVVLTDQVEVAPKDPGLLRECQKRIPHFKASRELDLTLSNMLDLEQLLSQRIDWVASEFTFDQFVGGQTDYPRYRASAMLPNANRRFCTEQLKLNPMFWHCYLNYFDGEPLLMNIGFRADEPRRIERWTCDNDKFKFGSSCNLKTKRWHWEEIEWRVSRFPLAEHGITKQQVDRYWLDRGWEFPIVSNCDFCFYHRELQQQIQYQSYPERSAWWMNLESKVGATFGTRPLVDIVRQPLLGVFDAEPCHCTD